MNTPLVSIIIVTYNAGATIAGAIDSVINQTYKNIELIIIDGQSSDNTVLIVKKYGDKISYFISEKDNGIYDAMNKGIAAAKGEWILFLGADDALYTPTVVKQIFDDSTVNAVDFLYGDVEFTSNKRRYGAQKNYQQLIEQNICHQAIFYKRTIFSVIGNYNIRYSILADYELNLRVFRQPLLQTKYTPVIVTLFNDKGASNTTIDKYFHGDLLQFFLQTEKIPIFSPLLQQYYFYYGYISVFNNHIFSGLKHIIVSWFTGKRKFFFFLLTGKFFVTNLIYKTIKIK